MLKKHEQHHRTGRPVVYDYSTWSRRSLHRFYGRAQTYCSQSDVFDSLKACHVMLTFETRIHLLEWFAQVTFVSATPVRQNLRIGLKKLQNGKSDVPVKQRGGWPKKVQKEWSQKCSGFSEEGWLRTCHRPMSRSTGETWEEEWQKMGQNSSKRQSSDARQLGCVFQDMTPPKSIIRKCTDMPKPIQRVKFTKAIARHTKIRDQNPSLGCICPGEPQERSHNAPKFEDRSQEETEWQEQGAREAAWKLAKRVLKLKEHERATFFSLSENRVSTVAIYN